MYEILLSPYAKTFFVEWKLNPNRSDYNIAFEQKFDSAIDVKRMEKAITRFVSDYIILNSHIKEKKGELFWVKNRKICRMEFLVDDYLIDPLMLNKKSLFNLEVGPLYKFILIKKRFSQ